TAAAQWFAPPALRGRLACAGSGGGRGLRLESLEDRRLLAVEIEVGDHVLLPNTPDQVIEIYVRSTDPDNDPVVSGFNLNAQLDDGDDNTPAPRFQDVDFTGGIWDAGPNADVGEFGDEYVTYGLTFFPVLNVEPDGLLVTLTIDTTGILATQEFDLLLKSSSLIGDDSSFVIEGIQEPFYPEITNGRLLIEPPNQPPVNSLPAPQTMNEGGLLTFSNVNLNSISITDPDAGSQPVQVTLEATNGTVTLGGTAGLTFSAGDGTQDALLTMTGTVSSINTALLGMVFDTHDDFHGAASLRVLTNDLGHTGSGGAQSDDDTLNITVNSVNDPPTLDPIANREVMTGGGSDTVNLTGITAGGGESQGLTVQISSSNTSLVLVDTLSYTSPQSTGSFIVRAAPGLGGLGGDAIVTVTVTDDGGTDNGGVNTFSRMFVVTVRGSSVLPTIDPIADPDPINEGAGQQTINLTGITDGEPPSYFPQQPLRVMASSNNPALISTVGVTYTSPNTTGTLTYTPLPDATGTAVITVIVEDSGLDLELNQPNDNAQFIEQFTVVVNPVNDPPVNTVPGAQSTNEDTPLVLSSANGNQVSTSDIDVGGGVMRVTLSVLHGTLTLSGTVGIDFDGGGNGQASMTLLGYLDNVNNALNGLRYDPNPNYHGSDTLTILTNDQGNTGSGGAMTDTDTVAIMVQPQNDPPTDIALSSTSLPENAGANAVVGDFSTVDVDTGDTYTYALATGSGDADNSAFNISGNQLRANASFDFETRTSYSVRVRSTDAGGLAVEREFTITVTNVNEGPTEIGLSGTTIPENSPANTPVGTFSTTDPDAGDTFTYALVAGSGDTNNGAFNIVGNELRATAGFNFEAQSSYSIRVRSTDTGGLSVEREFTITVTNVNEGPTEIALSGTSIPENSPANTPVGTFSTTDPDAGDTFTYTLVAGSVETYNGHRDLHGYPPRPTAGFNFEAQSGYSIRVRSTDAGGLSVEREFTITVTDVNEAPTEIGLSGTSIPENSPANTPVGTFSTTDPDAGDTFTYALVAGSGDTNNGAFNIV
ncbi:MAG: cadherin domain-containing protein, partial [Pirellulaceae bacterium]|nr:cadherin domain-containing protein [Pirellulaceae bacterium]